MKLKKKDIKALKRIAKKCSKTKCIDCPYYNKQWYVCMFTDEHPRYWTKGVIMLDK